MPRLFAEQLTKSITVDLEVTERSILNGAPTSFENYRERVGRVKAYRSLLEHIELELKKYIEDEDG